MGGRRQSPRAAHPAAERIHPENGQQEEIEQVVGVLVVTDKAQQHAPTQYVGQQILQQLLTLYIVVVDEAYENDTDGRHRQSRYQQCRAAAVAAKFADLNIGSARAAAPYR